jgi:hypothetical protein
MSLLSLFMWCENSAVGDAIRNSKWLFPFIEAIHLVGLALIGGAVLLVDLRLLGVVLRRQPVAQLAQDAQRWLIISLMIMIPTGALMFTSEAIKCYYHPAFWMKMTSLFLAIVFTFTVKRWVTMADETRIKPLWSKLVALVSVTLWLLVGIGGRWIGFS